MPYLVSRTETAVDNIFQNIFSAPRQDVPFNTIKARAIVEYVGQDSGDGIWTCSKDLKAVGCQHINVARRHLHRCLEGDMENIPEINGGVEYNCKYSEH